MDDNTLLLSEILQELRTLNHNIMIIYGNASHDIQDINANLGSIDSRLSSIDGNVFSIELSVT